MQSLGFFGIFKDSFKIIFSWKKIFSQITLALILPLSFIFLANIEMSELFYSKFLHRHALPEIVPGTSTYYRLSNSISSKWTVFWLLFKAAYLTIILILSLLSTAAVVFTIACIYAGKEFTFKKVMSVVPKVWKRLMVTFLWYFLVAFCYNILVIVAFVLWYTWTSNASPGIGLTVFVLLLILYLMGLVYMSIIWQLASVVTVLEDSYGIQAMKRSKALVKGKMGVAIGIFLLLNLFFGGTLLTFEIFGVYAFEGIIIRMGFGIGCLLLLVWLILIGLTLQTVLYFVCKSYHHEIIDKSSLEYRLEVYLGEYVDLKANNVQLGECHV
ncbi:hypothetical protein L1049_021255 [Liquidambar formosana]|uniref:Uncharacterized protein n=1 Tax=Liquidambar formosana TaxID=63359 RepID=A0AAP0SCK3_LIQFO